MAESHRIDKGTFGGQAMIGGYFKAEAVAVDLAQGKTLFLLVPQESDQFLRNAIRYGKSNIAVSEAVRQDGPMGQMRWMNEVRPIIELPRQAPQILGAAAAHPLLVTFTDLRDPKTVTRVDPDDLAKTFGPGIKLRRITLQVTDDPVTTGIEKRLGWLASVYEHLPKDFRPDRIPVGDFQRLFTTETIK